MHPPDLQQIQDIVYEHISNRRYSAIIDPYHRHDFVTQKHFTVKDISQIGSTLLAYEIGKDYTTTGLRLTERSPGFGRVRFLGNTVDWDHNAYFVEVKGDGMDGSDMCLWLHCDGDILGGMFYHNAKKEFRILQEARAAGLYVPIPLMLGKISRREWLRSGLQTAYYISLSYDPESEANSETSDNKNLTPDSPHLENRLRTILDGLPVASYCLNAWNKPYNPGLLMRACLSPNRVGDPDHQHERSLTNAWIARTCGQTFRGLINLGYLHLTPGTGNWTTAGEFTDMVDCYDLRRDKNLEAVIIKHEQKQEHDFWQDLIGPFHTGNLTDYFILGMLGETMSVKEAAVELKKLVTSKKFAESARPQLGRAELDLAL